MNPVLLLIAVREAEGVDAKPLVAKNGTASSAAATLCAPVDGSVHVLFCDWLAQ
jgi:hypothetical protein